MPPTPPNYDAAVKVLLGYYDRIEGDLIRQMANAARDSWEWKRCEALLAEARAEVATLQAQSNLWDAAAMRDAALAGAKMAEGELREAGISADALRISTGIPKEALAALAKEAAGQRTVLLASILRQSDDFLRRLTSGELAVGMGLGKSPYAIGKAIREGMVAGIEAGQVSREIARELMTATGVIYSDGSTHSLHAYAQMAAKTGLAAAQNAGSLQRYIDAGVPCVRVTENGTLCFICFPHEGKVYALTAAGEKLGYPPFASIRVPFHPHCRHRVSPVVYPDPEKDKAPDAVAFADTKDQYRDFKAHHPELHQASRQGFATRDEWRLWKEANPDVPLDQLRGPRWRYADIEQRRQAAIEQMLVEPDLSYADAVERQTRVFMAGEDYGKQKPEVTPAAQARNVALMLKG